MKYSKPVGLGWLKISLGKYFFNNDVLLKWDGSWKYRNRAPSKRYADLYSHTPLSFEEVESYQEFLRDCEVLIVGTGFESRMVVMDEVFKNIGINVISMDTPRAFARYVKEIERGTRACALFHLTC